MSASEAMTADARAIAEVEYSIVVAKSLRFGRVHMFIRDREKETNRS